MEPFVQALEAFAFAPFVGATAFVRVEVVKTRAVVALTFDQVVGAFVGPALVAVRASALVQKAALVAGQAIVTVQALEADQALVAGQALVADQT